jgi:teichuronic acid exporter
MIKGFKSDFISSIFTLVSGTVIAQIITYSLATIISRIYSPEDMSFLSLFSRIVAFFAVIATARYELAFPLPKRDEHAYSLFRVSIRILGYIFVLTLALSLIVGFFLEENSTLFSILYFIPFGILVTAFYNQGLNWSIRMKNFRVISLSRVLQTSLNSFSSVGFGLFGLGYKGLILGYLFGALGSSFVFLKFLLRTKARMKIFKLKGRNFAIAKYYSDFPKINLPHILIDLSKELFIAFYLLYSFEKEVLGLYDFAFRMLKMPIGLIGISIGQVFFKKSADLINEKKSILPLVRKTLLTLFFLSIIPFSLLFLFGSEIFAFVFGSNWKEAGTFSEIMSLWLMTNFIVSPVSQIPLLLNKQKAFFYLSLVGTFLMIFSLVFSNLFPSLNFTFVETLKLVSLTQFLFLTYVIFWTIKLVKNHKYD